MYLLYLCLSLCIDKLDNPMLGKQPSIDDPIFDDVLPLTGIRPHSLSAFPREDEASAFTPTKAFLKRESLSDVRNVIISFQKT